MDDCVDRISGLPDHILHHILSFLLTKDAIQTTATCKRLNEAWLTHPYLDLGKYFFPFLSGLSDSDSDSAEVEDEDEDDLEGDILAEHPPIVLVAEHPPNVLAEEVAEHPPNVLADEGAEHPPSVPNSPKFSIIANEAEHPSDIVDEERNIIIRKREVLFSFVEQTLTRMRMHDITIPKFSLGPIKLDVESIQHLDRWIYSLVQSNINELVLKVNDSYRKPYALPPILLTASSLHSLTLAGCKIPSGSLYFWRSLRKLDLGRVSVDENFLASIFNTCHDLEEFALDCCFGLGKRIHIPAKSNLKVFMIGIDDTVSEEVVVEAHHLEKLEYTAGIYPTTINIITNYLGSVSLLKLGGANVTNAWFCDLISRLPCLQELYLSQLNLKAIEISSSSLKRLKLWQVFYYKSIRKGEFVINAPNLVELNFIGNLSCVFQNSLAIKKVTIGIADLGVSKLEDEQLCSKLMHFLHKFDYSEVVTLDPILFEHMIIPVEKRLNLHAPLTHVKHFSLQGFFFTSPINAFAGLLESLLWIAPNLDTLSLKYKKSMEVYPIDLKLKSELIAGRWDCPPSLSRFAYYEEERG